MLSEVSISLASHTVEFEVFVASNSEIHVTKFAPHKVLKLVARGKLTCDDRVVALGVNVTILAPQKALK